VLGDEVGCTSLKEHPVNEPHGHGFLFVDHQPVLAFVVTKETAVRDADLTV
jgi:hypothetical protein